MNPLYDRTFGLVFYGHARHLKACRRRPVRRLRRLFGLVLRVCSDAADAAQPTWWIERSVLTGLNQVGIVRHDRTFVLPPRTPSPCHPPDRSPSVTTEG